MKKWDSEKPRVYQAPIIGEKGVPEVVVNHIERNERGRTESNAEKHERIERQYRERYERKD